MKRIVASILFLSLMNFPVQADATLKTKIFRNSDPNALVLAVNTYLQLTNQKGFSPMIHLDKSEATGEFVFVIGFRDKSPGEVGKNFRMTHYQDREIVNFRLGEAFRNTGWRGCVAMGASTHCFGILF